MQAAARAPAGIAVVIALVLAAAACSPNEEAPSGTEPLAPTPTETPHIKQAKWNFKTFKTAPVKSLRKRDLARFRAQRMRIKGLIRDVYDALFLTPDEKSQVVAVKFAGRAARSLMGSGAGMPARAERVKTLMRRARIGIQPTSARRAAAKVSIRARALVEGQKLRVVHHSTLWLERSHNRWRAIAFEVDQDRVR